MNIKLTSKKQKKLFSELLVGKEKEEITNPFSRESVMLEPEAVALYDFIKGAERLGGGNDMVTAMEIFRNNWPSEYMTLLD